MPELVPGARVLVVTTARRRAGGDRVAAALGSRCVGVWAGALPQVPRATAAALVARVRETSADVLLAHGGGTAIGASKAAALEVDVALAAVPTTFSGSEMTNIWGITDGGVKTTGRDERVRPSVVIYDPTVYAGVRPEVRNPSLLNALAHSVDALFDPAAAADVHADAEESIGAIVGALRHAGAPAALDEAVRGAHLAGRVLSAAAMALQHKLAHVLGGSFGTPHAATHAALLPHTTAFNLPAAPWAADAFRRALGPDPAGALFDLLGLPGAPRALSDLGFGAAQVPRAVALALTKRYANPRPVDAPGLTALLRAAVHGRRPETFRP